MYDEVRVVSGPLFLVEEDNTTGKSLVKYEVGTATNINRVTYLLLPF